MTDLREELFAAPVYTLQTVPFTASRHKWLLRWYRGDDGDFVFTFVSPQRRSYLVLVAYGRVTDASVVTADGYSIASYRDSWGDSPEGLDDVIRLIPKHIINRLHTLLDAIR